MDGGAWWAAIHGVANSRTRLSDFTFTFHFHALEKEMATHSSVLAWRIPGTAESVGSHRVGHDWSDLAAAAAATALPYCSGKASPKLLQCDIICTLILVTRRPCMHAILPANVFTRWNSHQKASPCTCHQPWGSILDLSSWRILTHFQDIESISLTSYFPAQVWDGINHCWCMLGHGVLHN